MPKISVIVPVYKVEKYIHRCVDSILAQTFTDFELILVDDGSPDNCGAICDEYATKDKRVKVVHQKNAGLSGARNAGIDSASGEYLCFIDSDDIISPWYCEVLYRTLTDTSCKMAACKMVRFSEQAGICYIEANDSVEICSLTEFLRKQMTGSVEMGVCNRLFHRSVFDRIRFAPGRLHEDIIFAGDLLTEDLGHVAYINEPLYYYRQRIDSIVNQQAHSSNCSPDRISAAMYLLECARKENYVYMEDCLVYAVKYPWFFVDSIYVKCKFRNNRQFLNLLQKLILNNIDEYRKLEALDLIWRKRMQLFACSKFLYGINAYARLLRVYIYHKLKWDAYSDGHGI